MWLARSSDGDAIRGVVASRIAGFIALTGAAALGLVIVGVRSHPELSDTELRIYFRVQDAGFSHALRGARKMGGAIGTGVSIVVVAVGGYLLGRVRTALVLIAGVVSSVLVTDQVLQRLIERPRAPFLEAMYGPDHFPSGHVVGASCSAIALVALAALAGAPRWAVAVASAAGALVIASVGWASIYTGDHYALDVIAGVLVAVTGMATAIAVASRVDRFIEAEQQNSV